MFHACTVCDQEFYSTKNLENRMYNHHYKIYRMSCQTSACSRQNDIGRHRNDAETPLNKTSNCQNTTATHQTTITTRQTDRQNSVGGVQNELRTPLNSIQTLQSTQITLPTSKGVCKINMSRRQNIVWTPSSSMGTSERTPKTPQITVCQNNVSCPQNVVRMPSSPVGAPQNTTKTQQTMTCGLLNNMGGCQNVVKIPTNCNGPPENTIRTQQTTLQIGQNNVNRPKMVVKMPSNSIGTPHNTTQHTTHQICQNNLSIPQNVMGIPSNTVGAPQNITRSPQTTTRVLQNNMSGPRNNVKTDSTNMERQQKTETPDPKTSPLVHVHLGEDFAVVNKDRNVLNVLFIFHTCPYCQKKYYSQKNFESHLKTHENDAENPPKNMKSQSDDITSLQKEYWAGEDVERFHTCSFCEQQFYSPKNLETHLVTHSDMQQSSTTDQNSDAFVCPHHSMEYTGQLKFQMPLELHLEERKRRYIETER